MTPEEVVQKVQRTMWKTEPLQERLARLTALMPPTTTQDFDAIEKRLIDLAASFGLKATFSPTMPDYAYVPGHIIYCGKEEERISNLAHDIAHFLVAAPHRRKKVDFGLGESPDSMENSIPSVSSKYADQEEATASALGTRIEAWAGHDPSWTLDWHGWDGPGGDLRIYSQLMRLVDRNLLHDDFRFTPERARLGANL